MEVEVEREMLEGGRKIGVDVVRGVAIGVEVIGAWIWPSAI